MIFRFLEGEELIEVISDYTQYLSDINTYHFFSTAFQILDLKEKGFFLGTDIETISKDLLKKNELDTKSLDEKLNGIKKEQVLRIKNAILNLSTLPQSHQERIEGRYARKGYRQLLVDNYIVIFRIDEINKTVHVVTVQYQRRNI